MSVTPKCPYFGLCGGCQHQDVVYEEQLRRKQEFLKELYRQEVPVRSQPTSYEYRNRMDFVCTPKGIGLRGDNYNDVVDIQHCAIANPAINHALQIVREWVEENEIPLYDLKLHEGFLRYVVIRGDEHEVQVTLTTKNSFYEQEIAQLAEQLAVTSLVWTIEESKSNQSVGSETHKVFGKESIKLSLAGKQFLIDSHTFFQTSPYMAQQAVEEIRRHVPGNVPVYDLYCGVGVLGQCVADEVVGVESVTESVEQARKNAKHNEVTATYHCADAAAWLLGHKPEVVLVDPPRAGLGVGAQGLLAAKPKKIIYLSCNPKSQKRDLVRLERAYDVVHLEAFDFFAHTAHVECLAVLKRKD